MPYYSCFICDSAYLDHNHFIFAINSCCSSLYYTNFSCLKELSRIVIRSITKFTLIVLVVSCYGVCEYYTHVYIKQLLCYRESCFFDLRQHTSYKWQATCWPWNGFQGYLPFLFFFYFWGFCLHVLGVTCIVKLQLDYRKHVLHSNQSKYARDVGCLECSLKSTVRVYAHILFSYLSSFLKTLHPTIPFRYQLALSYCVCGCLSFI